MSLKKKYLKSKPVCKVTFKLSAKIAADAEEASVVGSFNDWDPSASPMKKLKKGGFSFTIDLDTGQEYQFRYVLDGERWLNDEEADGYVAAGVGYDENSVINI